jgi:hypothetical protein
MPTNPNWIEHTERAAWDTVKTLRKQIAEERERIARFAPARESWQRIAERLDAAKAAHSIEAEQYADIVDHLTAELGRLKAERDSLSTTVAQREAALREASLRVEVVPLSAAAATLGDDDESAGAEHWFLERVAARSQDGGRARKKRKLENLLTAAEQLLEQLEEAPREEAVDLAVDLATLALSIAELRRRRAPRRED